MQNECGKYAKPTAAAGTFVGRKPEKVLNIDQNVITQIKLQQ